MSSRATTFLGGTRSSRDGSVAKASFATSGDMTAPGTPQAFRTADRSHHRASSSSSSKH